MPETSTFPIDNTLVIVHSSTTAARKSSTTKSASSSSSSGGGASFIRRTSYFVKTAKDAVETVKKQGQARLLRQPLVELWVSDPINKPQQQQQQQQVQNEVNFNLFLLIFK